MNPQAPVDIAVIGAGAAGLMAAAVAAQEGARVTLLEKNAKTGVKILMSGGTRCNITHDTNARGIASAFGTAGRFLQPSLGRFPPASVVKLFHYLGVQTKVESTGKVFPVSDRALHVRDALEKHARQSGVDIQLKQGVRKITPDSAGTADRPRWWIDTDQQGRCFDRVIITSGGRSWPGCGTTGDGYGWLGRLGHAIVRPRPALVPLVGGTGWMHDLSGLTLPDTVATVRRPDTKAPSKPLVQRRASWLFTHFGFSGPAAMDVSGVMTASEMKDVGLSLDLIPNVSNDHLRSLLQNRGGGRGRRMIASLLAEWLPQRLAEAITRQCDAQVTLAELKRESMQRLVSGLKQLTLPVHDTRGFGKAEVTAGGVSLSEVDPKTMASRLHPGLYIAGEVLDVDGWIGGYNFQAAFSTGHAAGLAAARDDGRA
ncbi:MAG: aminoacetone oxidase family FAD-binding enzyme [Planctomycetota bacterium]